MLILTITNKLQRQLSHCYYGTIFYKIYSLQKVEYNLVKTDSHGSLSQSLIHQILP